MGERIRVGVAEDQPLMRRALAELVDQEEGLDLVGVAADGVSAIRMVRGQAPDVLLTDLAMPDLSGVDVMAVCRDDGTETRFLALTTFGSMTWILSALRAGAAGYLVKDASPAEIVEAVRSVHEDTTVLSPSVAAALVEHVAASPLPAARTGEVAPDLPDRLNEALRLLAGGLSNREIAARMHVSEAAVKQYLRRLGQALGVRDRVQILIRGLELGMVSPRLDREDTVS